jgi:hypothetical protein
LTAKRYGIERIISIATKRITGLSNREISVLNLYEIFSSNKETINCKIPKKYIKLDFLNFFGNIF